MAAADRQAELLLVIEAAAVFAAAGRLRAAVAAFAREARSRWIVTAANPAARQLAVGILRRRLYEMAADPVTVGRIAPAIRNHAVHAARAGAEAAVPSGRSAAALPADPVVREVARSAGRNAASHLRAAEQLLRQAETPMQLAEVVAEAGQSVTTTELAAAYAVHHAANAAVRREAARYGAEVIWIAERDACVVCAALSGHVANPGEGGGFDEFATFGPHRPAAPWPPGHPLLQPPRHPRCRCQLQAWYASLQPDFPSALKREAARSILKGWSRPSESHSIRIAAARQLLAAGGAGLPISVQRASAHAVAAGRFTTRSVPRWPADQPRRATV